MARVLVVEDNEDSAVAMARLLRLFGHEVEVAADGLSGLQAVQLSQPDVVLLDIGLPKMDGWQVAKHIREQGKGKKPFLIAMTGYSTQADRLRSVEAGIDVHLVKPVDPEELKNLLSRCDGSC
jgi:CheY-like chemotaxis protein